MSEQRKIYPDSGSLFSNQPKISPKAPDYNGTIYLDLSNMTNIQKIDGFTVVRLSGWKKVAKNGKTYLSLAVDRFERKKEGEKPKVDPVDDEDVPF
jgi:hypothetical protein